MKLTQDPETDSREQLSPVTHTAPSPFKKLIKVDYSALSSDEEEDEVLKVTKVDDDDGEKLELDGNVGGGVGGVPGNGIGSGGVGTNTSSAANPWTRTGSLTLSKAEIDHYCDTALQCTAPNYNSLRSQCCIL